MCNSFASSLWMLPFSKHCQVDHQMCSNLRRSGASEGPHLFCDEKEFEGNTSSWPVDLVTVDLPASAQGKYYNRGRLSKDPLLFFLQISKFHLSEITIMRIRSLCCTLHPSITLVVW